MKNVVALIDLHNSPELGLITEKRPLASTPILGRYAFIDFTLSNLTNSGIDDIGILIKNYSRSVIKHIGNENTYLKNSKTGFLNFMINEKGIHNPLYNTDLNNLKENDYFLYDTNCKYVIIVPVGFVCKVNYDELIKEHINSGKALSIVYSKVKNAGKDFLGLNKIVVDSLNNVQKVEKVSDLDQDCSIGLQTFIVNKDFFAEALKRSTNISSSITICDLFLKHLHFVEGVHAIEYKGYFKYFRSMKSYYDYSLENKEMLYEEGNPLFNSDWKFYTRTHDTCPALYGENSEVSDSIISNGCNIGGKVKGSLLSRNVIVEEGATVEDSIIFSDCVIKKGVHLKNVIADKLCTFKSKEEVFGTKEEPLYVPQGEIL